MSKSPTLFSSDDEDEGPHNEVVLLKKFQAMLNGVPPPSSITLSKLSCCDMLEKYKENCDSFGLSDLKSQKCTKKTNSTPLVYYLNTSKTSEEIANLSQKIISRFVYSETMSSCNIWFDSYITNSEKKLQARRNRIGFSPGSRLSHLARRRSVFCSENLQKLANSEKRRHIEIEKQKSCKSKNSFSSNLAELEKHASFKRALFLSPDEDEANRLKVLNSSTQQNLFTVANSKMLHEGRRSVWLSQQNSNIGSSRKRKRTESREGSGNWPRRALTFTEDDLNRSQDFNSKKTKIISEIQLSLHHKSKLLWAVSVSLKEKNMQSNDPQFKTCASSLFMICRKNISKILSSKIEGGTSDKMLHFARQHVDDIFKKLGISREKKHGNKSSQSSEGLENKMDPLKNVSEEDKESSSDFDKQTFVNKINSCDSEGPSESSACSTSTDDSSRLNEKENFDAVIIL